MSKPLGKKFPAKEAMRGIEAYRKAMQGSPYYRESISYTIAELRDYLDAADKELQKMGIRNDNERCISMMPYLSDDGKLNILLTPSADRPASVAANGRFKHRYNVKVRPAFGAEGKGVAEPDPNDPDNPYNGGEGEDPEDPYNHGSGRP